MISESSTDRPFLSIGSLFNPDQCRKHQDSESENSTDYLGITDLQTDNMQSESSTSKSLPQAKRGMSTKKWARKTEPIEIYNLYSFQNRAIFSISSEQRCALTSRKYPDCLLDSQFGHCLGRPSFGHLSIYGSLSAHPRKRFQQPHCDR